MTEIYALTDIGKIRTHNEDCFLINHYVASAGEYSETVDGDFLVAAADGMGGANAGEVASSMALNILSQRSSKITNDELIESINEIHQKIIEYGKIHKEAEGLGTTLCGLINRGGEITIFNVGDSRIYRFRDGILKQLTRDHSLVQVLLESGKITRDEVLVHPQKHLLLQSLGGGSKNVQPDIETLRGTSSQGDLFLLCSDGLSDLLSPDEIEDILNQNIPLNQSLRTLVAKANELGGEDNITVIGIKIITS